MGEDGNKRPAKRMPPWLSGALKKLQGGSSMRPTRLLVMAEAPSIDANEITDKGYMNQRAVRERRAALVEELYSGSPEVIRATS